MSAFYRSPRKPWQFLSVIFSAVIIISLLSPFATRTAYALAAPQPIYPGDGATTTPVTDPPLGVPSFSWSVVSGATSYRLQVDSEIGFNPPITVDIQTANTSYTPSNNNHLLVDGVWYWRVRVEAPTPVSPWSAYRTFTKLWTAPGFNNPTPIEPESGDKLAFFNPPGFSWTPVLGAAKYRFQIATSEDGFNSPIMSSDTLTTTIQPKDRLANGEYWWRVLPIDVADHLGTSSTVNSFTMAYGTYISPTLDLVPELITPQDETFPEFTPTFHWKAVIGAEHYRLEYTSNEQCDFSVGTAVETRQTSYTPIDTFMNDRRYCWHVRVESGSAAGEWSETWHFQKKWYLQPQLLTPTNLYQTGLYPLYSWTPVPGASRYRIDIDDEYTFTPPLIESHITANTTYAHQEKYIGTDYYYWRVTPIDGGGELGMTSDVSEFQSYYTSTAPILVYPLYYYPPNDHDFYGDNTMNPVENRTVAYPIFMWHRIMNPYPVGGVYANAYRIQVDTTPYFDAIVWEYDTENTSASPTSSDGFVPLIDQDYFWRVCPLDGMGGVCLVNPDTGLVWWSQIWKARFDPTYDPADPNPWVLPPTTETTPVLLRPSHGQESIEATPLLEWWPMQGATQYQVEVSRDSSFSTYEISETVTIPAYSPVDSLTQRSLNKTDYGTFYWRVRGFAGSAWSDWSNSWRFQVASQSEWRYVRALGDPANRLLIGSDQVGDASETYDLSALYASQQGGDASHVIPAYWYLGFNANLTTTDMTYVFYIDLDHIDGSGASSPPPTPRDYSVTTVAAHQPEYAIFVDKLDGGVDAAHTWVFAWTGSWAFGQKLEDIGGAVYTSTGYVELRLPNASIGMSQVTGSASVMLFSVDTTTKQVMDSVPSDPSVPGSAQLGRFSAVSERMNLIFPPSTDSGDVTTIPSFLPFYWDWPTGSNPSSPFAGNRLELHVDPGYTSLKDDFVMKSIDTWFGQNVDTILGDLVGDNIYYWRVQPRYKLPAYGEVYGAWATGWSFRRIGFTAKELNISVNWATPTFSWDMAEGASTYRLQVATDPNFGGSTIVIDLTTPMNTYTPVSTLAPGVYYWRVQVNRYNTINESLVWSEIKSFSLALPAPTGLTPNGGVVHYAPTFCWDPLVKLNPNPPFEPILTAWKYRLQVSRDGNFSAPYETVDTNNNCWTPTKGYADGPYYWHVAMIDGNGRLGTYSATATFTKQYPMTTLISPIGGISSVTPTFKWTPVNGAATYVLEVSKYPSFTPGYDSITTFNTHFTPTKIYDTRTLYYWHVAIKDRDNNQGPYNDATVLVGVGSYFYLPLVKRGP